MIRRAGGETMSDAAHVEPYSTTPQALATIYSWPCALSNLVRDLETQKQVEE